MKLADALDAPTGLPVGQMKSKRRATLEDVLSPDEIDLILRYRALSQEKRIKLIGILIGLTA